MEERKLISMVDFVFKKDLEHDNDSEYDSFTFMNDIVNHAKFKKEKPELGMFIFCDLEGNMLEEPKRYKDYIEYPDSFDGNKEEFECIEYQEAKDRVIFEGWEMESQTENAILLFQDKISLIYDKKNKTFSHGETIEDLVPLGLIIKNIKI